MAVLHGFIRMQDCSSPTGSRLFGGSVIDVWAAQVNISSKQELDVPFKTGQEPEFINTSVTKTDNTNIGSMWNRRKSYVTSAGTNNMQINLTINWEATEVGSAMANWGVGSPLRMTPYKLWRMQQSGHTFHIRGGNAIQSIINGEADDQIAGTQVGSPYSGSGIPVVISDISFDDVSTMQDYVTTQVSLIENKDLTFLTN